MILQANYDKKYKRIIFFRDADEYIYKTDLKTNGIHYALINNKYEFAIYLDSVTQKRLDKTKAFMQNRGWEIQINEDLFAQIGVPELDKKTYDERIECLFIESTYDVINQQFVNYQETINNTKYDEQYLDADLWSSVLTVISNGLSRLKWDSNNGVIDEALNLDVKKFVRQLIDDECERFRSYSRRYEVPLQTLYYRHQNNIIAPLDWAVRRNYVKVLMKHYKKVVSSQPSLLSTDVVLNYIDLEIENGWNKNQAIVALSKLMTMITTTSIKRHDLYQSIKKGSFKPETQEAQRCLDKLNSASESERNEALYFFDTIIIESC